MPVTPHAGVRIEIFVGRITALFACVTPHAGVRIEIVPPALLCLGEEVTPHAGVRIEIRSSLILERSASSPPTRGCELK